MRRIFIKPELCAGCKNCQATCLAEHSPSRSVWLVNLSDRGSRPRNFVELNNAGQPVPLSCRHCDEPECVNACMSGALCKDPATGMVTHNPEQCAGCWMCVMSCPFGMIFPDARENKVAAKCDFCADRDKPRCVEACPTGAITLIEAPASNTDGKYPNLARGE
jgi:carbon-monoxide dehydrogenase iron sulfur subunit